MALNNVPSGKSLPNDFNVIIEIPAHADPVKYEVDKESGAIFVDRFMGTAMHYPCNYGYIPHTIAGDGDPVDVLVVTQFPLPPGVVVRCRPIGMLGMTDEAGPDAKLLAVTKPTSACICIRHRGFILAITLTKATASSTTRHPLPSGNIGPSGGGSIRNSSANGLPTIPSCSAWNIAMTSTNT